MNSRTTEIATLTMTGGEVRLGAGVLRLDGSSSVLINPTTSGSQITSTDFNNDINLENEAHVFEVANGSAVYDLDVQAGITTGQLLKQGAGTLRLAGTSNTTLSVELRAGALALASNGALGTTGGVFRLAGGRVMADGADRTLNNPVVVSDDATIGSSVDGTPRAFTFSGTLSLDLAATLTVANAATTTLPNVISGEGSIVKSGPGTLTLGNVGNTFTGGLVINGGTVNAASDGSLGAAAANVVTVNAGRLNFTGANVTTARTFVLNNSGTLTPSAGGTLTYAAGANVNGGNLGAGGNHLFSGGSALNGVTSLIGSALNQTGGTVAFDNVTLRGSFTQAPGATLNATSGLTVTSSGALAIFGTTNLVNGGEINGLAAINNGGVLSSTGGNLFLGGGSRTTINVNGALNASPGTSLELNGGLLVNNGTQSGALNVNFGGVAKGAGVFGAVIVTDGGRFSPGNSPGAATLESLSLTGGAHYEFELTSALAAPGIGADFLSVLGALTLGDGLAISIASLDETNAPAPLDDFDATRAHVFPLATAGTIVGFDEDAFTIDISNFQNDLAGGSFTVAQSGNDLVLKFSPVPEPATGVLLFIGALGVLRRRRAAL